MPYKLSRRSVVGGLGALGASSLLSAQAAPSPSLSNIKALSASLEGPVVIPSSGDEYDIARALWNGYFDKKPAAIASCRSAADVVRCIDFARKLNLPLSVKGGGHHPAGYGSNNGGLVIDLSEIAALKVDVSNNRVRLGPAIRVGELQAALEPHQRYAATTMVSTVGVAGMTLGGGFGWFSSEAGLACDNLLSAEIVTADGRVRHVDAQNEPDLLWALRGGGANFGVVTSLEIGIHALAPLTFGALVFSGPDLLGVLKRWRDYCATLPREMFVGCLVVSSPAPSVVMMVKSSLSGVANDREIAKLRAFAKPVQDMIRSGTLTELQALADTGTEAGYRYFANSHFFNDLSDAVLGVMTDALQNAPKAEAMMYIGPDHGMIRETKSDATAFFHREAYYNFFVMSRWSAPDEDSINISWVRSVWDRLKPHSTGQIYVNYLSETDPKWADIAYGENHARLRLLKKRYDPDNIFKSNVNILPMK